MEYYKLLQLEREPFSNSPDPNYFFQSRRHQACLQKIELAVRLRRGLNVVVGDVGTGKTTLCRELIRRLADQDNFESHLILDPSFHTARELLETLYEMLCSRKPDDGTPAMGLKEAIKQALFTKGVEQNRTIVLIIDEGQKIPDFCVEILRELLNYETNEFKLLQTVIFAQKEFEIILQAHANFADRINVLHHLEPMSFKDTRRMIHHRLKLSSSGIKPLDMFTLPAHWAIYRNTKGYPRRIIHLCHQSILTMIIQNRSRAGWRLIQSCKKRMLPSKRSQRKLFGIGAPATVAIALLLVSAALFFRFYFNPDQTTLQHFKVPSPAEATLPETAPAPPALPEPSTAAADSISNLPVAEQELNLPDQEPAIQPPGEPLDAKAPEPAALQAQISQAEPMTGKQRDAEISEPHPALQNEQPLPEPQPPARLGSLTVRAGDSISRMVLRVYGRYRNAYAQAVIDANPQLQDPNNIRLGETISMPALDFKLKTPSTGYHWVVLDRCGNLAEAMRLSDAFSRSIHAATRTMALWSPDKGIHFELLLKGYFENRDSAQIQVDMLPAAFARKAHIISGWDDKTRIYSDPYAGGLLQEPIATRSDT